MRSCCRTALDELDHHQHILAVSWPTGGRQRAKSPVPSFLLAILACAFAAHCLLNYVFVGSSRIPTKSSNSRHASGQQRLAQHSQSLSSAQPADGSKSTFQQLFATDRRPVVLYDGVCNMCNRAVDVAADRDPEGNKFRFAALQSNVGRNLLVFCGRSADDLSSMVVVKNDGICLTESDAALFVGKALDTSPLIKGASSVVSGLIPKAVRDAAYGVVAGNRYRVLGRRDELRLGDDNRADRFVSDAATNLS